jgi:hypothetical protein
MDRILINYIKYLPSTTIRYGEEKTDTSLKCPVNIQYLKD